MGHRYELAEQQWNRLAPLLPHPRHHGGRGRPLKDHRRVFNGILWRLHTGAPWRDIPERYGSWKSIYTRFRRWRRDGTWAKVLTQLLGNLTERVVGRFKECRALGNRYEKLAVDYVTLWMIAMIEDLLRFGSKKTSPK